MPKEPGYRWKLGLFATITLLLLVIAIFVIGRQKNLFGSVFSVSTVFHSVSGLKVGNNVRFGGIDVGTIDDIQLVTDTTVRVDMVIQSNVKRFIHKDAVASISSDGLMGDKVIVIAAGSDSTAAHQAAINGNDVLQSRAPIETDQILASLKVTADNAAIITTQLVQITSRINSGKGALGKLLKDTTLSSNISSTMKNLKKSSEGLSENMEAAKHNFLLRGYFKKKEKKKQEEAQKKQQQEEDKKQGDGKKQDDKKQ
jgi:phospholipid/cholesterol/gamma-HCH transport system substrate-binding protein